MFYVIKYESGEIRECEFSHISDAVNYANSCNSGYSYTLDEYESYEDYKKEEEES